MQKTRPRSSAIRHLPSAICDLPSVFCPPRGASSFQPSGLPLYSDAASRAQTRGEDLRKQLSAAAALFLGLLLPEPVHALDPARTLPQYVHDVWRTDDGLPQATIEAIVQTRDGYLWLGTEEGLARFDGVRFVTFNSRGNPVLGDDHVLALLEDRRGNLWIGTSGGGLIRHRDSVFVSFGGPEFVYSLYEDRAGTVWIGTRGGLARVENARVRTSTLPAIDGKTIWSIHEDRTGAMWLGTDLYGLARIERGAATTFTRATGLPHDAITALTELKDGRLIIGTNGAGLHEWNGERFVPFRASGTLPSGAITALLEDSARNLWVGTTAGLVRIHDRAMLGGAPGDLSSSPINALAEDAEGSLWIGTTSAGLHRLRDGKAYTITAADGLPSDRTNVVLHDREGGTWVGTRNGAVHFANGKTTTYTTANGLPNPNVRSLFQSSDGAIWLGTQLGGVVRITGASLEVTVLDPDVPDNTIRAFAEQPGRGVWVGSNGGRLTLFAGGKPVHRVAYEDSRRLFVRAMAVDRNGALWIATDGSGLAQLTGRTTRYYTRRDGLSSNSLRSLYIDAEGTVWIGTDGRGLNRLKDGKVTVYDTRSGLFDGRILQILEGDDGRIWMSSNNGIFAVEKRALQAFAEHRISRVQSLFIDDREGMITRDCAGGSQPAGMKKSDGTLWFPTDGGVAVVDPRGVHENTHLPPVQIERVNFERTPVYGTSTFVLPKGTRNLEIAYTALSFTVPERVRFRYRLEGYDESWIDAGTRRTAYYTALPPGDYRFFVIAANNDGVWNPRGATVTISLPPYFHQRRAFGLLVAALIAVGIWLIVALRIRKIRRDAARNAEMERRLVVVQKMDALGHLATGIAHDFNNTLMAAYPWAELIQRDYPGDSKLQKAAHNIVLAVERAKKVTRQLLDFAHPKPPEVTPFDLGELVREQLSMARSLLPRECTIDLSVTTSRGATGDRAKIGQVLLNLLLNASDAMPNGGRITVDVREPSLQEASSWDVAPGEMVMLSVSDTGTGIAPDVIPHVFDPFYTTKAIGKGTGLGLAVVHRIVQDHHGTVQLESRPGKGTTVHVLLPKGEVPVRKPEPAVAESAKSKVDGRTVLLIDDEAVTIEVVRTILQAEGATVHTATTGQDAFRQLAGGLRPEMVILDLGLPEMPGEQVHGLLRVQYPTLPILIASGYGDRERLDPLLRDPYTRYLQKPYPIHKLVEAVGRMTAGSDHPVDEGRAGA